MRYTVKRIMALLIALLLAVPTFALAEEPVEAVQVEGQRAFGDEADQQVDQAGEISLPFDPEAQPGEEAPPG